MSRKNRNAFNGHAARNGNGYFFSREAREAHVKSILHRYEAPNNWSTQQRLDFIKELREAGEDSAVEGAIFRLMTRLLPPGEQPKQGALNRYKTNLGRHARPDEIKDILDEAVRMIKIEKIDTDLSNFLRNNISFFAEEDPGIKAKEMDRADIEFALEKFAQTFIAPAHKSDVKRTIRDHLMRSHDYMRQSIKDDRFPGAPMLNLDLNRCARTDLSVETVWGFSFGKERQRFLYTPPAARV